MCDKTCTMLTDLGQTQITHKLRASLPISALEWSLDRFALWATLDSQIKCLPYWQNASLMKNSHSYSIWWKSALEWSLDRFALWATLDSQIKCLPYWQNASLMKNSHSYSIWWKSTSKNVPVQSLKWEWHQKVDISYIYFIN